GRSRNIDIDRQGRAPGAVVLETFSGVAVGADVIIGLTRAHVADVAGGVMNEGVVGQVGLEDVAVVAGVRIVLHTVDTVRLGQLDGVARIAARHIGVDGAVVVAGSQAEGVFHARVAVSLNTQLAKV